MPLPGPTGSAAPVWATTALTAALILAGCATVTDPAADEPTAGQIGPPASSVAEPDGSRLAGAYEPRVVAEYPHDPEAFTQGLEWYDGALLESTGLRGKSSVRRVDIATGEPLGRIDLDDRLFAEGLTVVDERVIQLTWQDQTLVVTPLSALAADPDGTPDYRADAYQGEGWGLCATTGADGAPELIMSDGSATLTRRDPTTMAERSRVEVTLDGTAVSDLNELECVGDQVLANVWTTDTILAIDADTGMVAATIDASALVPPGLTGTNDVLNGIAAGPDGTFYLTGKRWPVLYQVRFESVP
ncbi:MAG: glutaminyl-peptide cyclotransferase [Acidimicrobiales bacterium]